VEGDASFDEVGWPGRREREGQPIVDDPEPRDLDALTEAVGGVPVAGLAGLGPLLGEGDDLGRDGRVGPGRGMGQGRVIRPVWHEPEHIAPRSG
jgi:hypothetical protein